MEFRYYAVFLVLLLGGSCHPGVAGKTPHIKGTLIGPDNLIPVLHTPVTKGVSK